MSGGTPLVEWRDRIVVDPEVITGKPVIKGTRLTVDLVIQLLAEGWSTGQIIEEYPGVTADDVGACLAYASELVRSEKVYPARAV